MIATLENGIEVKGTLMKWDPQTLKATVRYEDAFPEDFLDEVMITTEFPLEALQVPGFDLWAAWRLTDNGMEILTANAELILEHGGQQVNCVLHANKAATVSISAMNMHTH